MDNLAPEVLPSPTDTGHCLVNANRLLGFPRADKGNHPVV